MLKPGSRVYSIHNSSRCRFTATRTLLVRKFVATYLGSRQGSILVVQHTGLNHAVTCIMNNCKATVSGLKMSFDS